jgi:AcrR family transcriptional regulator
MENITHRQTKAAKLKLLIVQSARELLVQQDFSQIHVTDLCKKVKISKVTFFRYFPQKEDLLLYMMRLNTFEYLLQQHHKPLKGKTAIQAFFAQLIKFHTSYPSVLPHILKHYAASDKVLKPINIKKAEKLILYPDKPEILDVELLSIDRILDKHLLEAVLNKEIKSTSNVEEMQRLLMSTFYGSILVSKMRQFPVQVLLKRNVEYILEQLN